MERIETFEDLKREIEDLWERHTTAYYNEPFNSGYYVALSDVLVVLKEYFDIGE